jgi:16S rRNA (guanine527-N7)-methyltransferase
MEKVAGLNVSRETLEDLRAYEALVKKWNPAINLVAKGSLSEFWDRHIVDSVQIFQFASEKARLWVDIGSGGGMPGLVVAILAKSQNPNLKVLLIESDQRKSTFLRTVIRELGLSAEVWAKRVEDVEVDHVDVLSARALASLDELFELSKSIVGATTQQLYLKGRRYEEEVKKAVESWHFDIVAHPSITDKESRILDIRNLKRAN